MTINYRHDFLEQILVEPVTPTMKRTLRDRMQDLIWESHESERPAPIKFFSNESIKLIFDVVRNFGLFIGVAYGSLVFHDRAMRMAEPESYYIFLTLTYVVGFVALMLFLMNSMFLMNIFEEYEFYRRKNTTIRWAFFLGGVVNILGCLLVVALWFSRPGAQC